MNSENLNKLMFATDSLADYLSPSRKNSLKLMRHHPNKITSLNIKFTDDPDFILEAVQFNPLVIKYAHVRFLSNYNIISCAIKDCYRLVGLVPTHLEPEMAHIFINVLCISDGDAFIYMSSNLRNNPRITAFALQCALLPKYDSNSNSNSDSDSDSDSITDKYLLTRIMNNIGGDLIYLNYFLTSSYTLYNSEVPILARGVKSVLDIINNFPNDKLRTCSLEDTHFLFC